MQKKKEEEKLNIERHNKRFLLQFTNRNCNATSISKLSESIEQIVLHKVFTTVISILLAYIGRRSAKSLEQFSVSILIPVDATMPRRASSHRTAGLIRKPWLWFNKLSDTLSIYERCSSLETSFRSFDYFRNIGQFWGGNKRISTLFVSGRGHGRRYRKTRNYDIELMHR